MRLIPLTICSVVMVALLAGCPMVSDDTTAPSLTIGAPSVAATQQGPVTFRISYIGATGITLQAGDVSINGTGSATARVASVSTTGGNQRNVTLDTISGDGTLTITIAAGTATDDAGNLAAAAGPSAEVVVDNTNPTVSIGEPSAALTNTGPIDYPISYDGAESISLSQDSVLLNGTGTVAATLADVESTGDAERTVSFSSLSGDGTIGFTIAEGTATDAAGNRAPEAGPSSTVVVDNTPPNLTISAPSTTNTNVGPITYRVTYEGADAITLSDADVLIDGTGLVVVNVESVVETSENVWTITLANLAGNGTAGISIAEGTATDAAGNRAGAAGPSETVDVDNIAPTVTIGEPSVAATSEGPVVFTITYEGADTVTLSEEDITVSATGTAMAQVSDVTETDAGTWNVTLGSVIGNGTFTIALAAGTATDQAGNEAPTAGPSSAVEVNNTAPTLLISEPSAANTFSESITYTVTYADAETITLAAEDVTLNSEDGVTATIAISGTGATERTITLSDFTGTGAIGISIGEDTAQNNAAVSAPAAGPSATFQVNPLLKPGAGFSEATPQPDPIGDPGAPGIDAKAIARWDVVPYQTFDGYFEIGVVAFHINDIDRVEFSVDGGPWVAVREMTLNPRTDVVEYWVGLDARDFEDGPIEVRAVAYPVVGEARVLGSEITSDESVVRGEHAIFLSTNANNTLLEIGMYVSPTGDDDSGDGSEGAPFASMMRAAREIQNVSTSDNADGGMIYLLPGEHRLGTYDFSLRTITESRWLTIQRAPGVSREEVTIVGRSGDALRTRLVKLESLNVIPENEFSQSVLKSNGPLEDYYWVNNCMFVGPGRSVDSTWTSGLTDVYVTNCSITQSRDGIPGAINRNVQVFDIGSDAFTGTELVVNSSADGLNAGGTTFHADVLQFHSGGAALENRIAYGVTARSGGGQGFFAGDNIPITDIAFINCDISNQEGVGTVALAFQFMGPTEHLYVRNSIFPGRASWRTDASFSAHNVVVENTVFSYEGDMISPGSVFGVIYR